MHQVIANMAIGVVVGCTNVPGCESAMECKSSVVQCLHGTHHIPAYGKSHRKRDLKLFEKRRSHPSLTRQGMQPGQAHTNALDSTHRGKAASKVSWVIQSDLPILAAGRGADELPSGKEICPIPTACTGHRQTQRCHQQSRVRPGSAERGLLL